MTFPFSEAKIISKPWGNEVWISDATQVPYALKKITFFAGNRSSLQVHKFKIETNYVLSGRGKFQICEKLIDVDAYLASTDRENFLEQFILELVEVEVKPGDILHVQKGQIHRVIAESDLIFIEASTSELDDVIRLNDDTNRGHGKIEIEHGG
jgi:mannose-6-phosphate isomerase-like protein (cupin superfamily)